MFNIHAILLVIILLLLCDPSVISVNIAVVFIFLELSRIQDKTCKIPNLLKCSIIYNNGSRFVGYFYVNNDILMCNTVNNVQ